MTDVCRRQRENWGTAVLRAAAATNSSASVFSLLGICSDFKTGLHGLLILSSLSCHWLPPFLMWLLILGWWFKREGQTRFSLSPVCFKEVSIGCSEWLSSLERQAKIFCWARFPCCHGNSVCRTPARHFKGVLGIFKGLKRAGSHIDTDSVCSWRQKLATARWL